MQMKTLIFLTLMPLLEAPWETTLYSSLWPEKGISVVAYWERSEETIVEVVGEGWGGGESRTKKKTCGGRNGSRHQIF